MLIVKLSAVWARRVSVCLASLLVLETFAGTIGAQAPQLRIVILEGDGAINDIKSGKATDPIIRVEDQDARPVQGALVVFTLPSVGAGGVFSDGSKSLIVNTDSQGQAAARGLRPNPTEGPFRIRVDASFQGLAAGAFISQTNVVPIAVAVRKSSTKMITLLAVIAGAAAAGAFAAKGKGGAGATTGTVTVPSSAVTITPGAPAVGPPQ